MALHDQTEVIRRLHEVVQTGLPPETAAFGTRLLDHLTGPVRILVLGRTGAGKSLLAQLLSRQKDLPALQVLEMTFPDKWSDLAAAASQADIILWCAQECDTTELDHWAKLPDVVKDHSFLIVTKADLLASHGTLHATIEAVTQVASDEFHSLFPLATLIALQAGGTDQGQQFRTSGAASLLAALRRQIALAREAARDSAYIFLDRYSSVTTQIDPVPVVEKSELRSSTTSIWTEPVSYLLQQSAQLQKVALLPLPEKIRVILEHCNATIDGLVALTENFDPVAVEASDLKQEILQVADTMVLLQLEDTASAATDALSLLLQLRRDMVGHVY